MDLKSMGHKHIGTGTLSGLKKLKSRSRLNQDLSALWFAEFGKQVRSAGQCCFLT